MFFFFFYVWFDLGFDYCIKVYVFEQFLWWVSFGC